MSPRVLPGFGECAPMAFPGHSDINQGVFRIWRTRSQGIRRAFGRVQGVFRVCFLARAHGIPGYP
eukprot:1244054-Lingulodinium_polyedra.AAC.1